MALRLPPFSFASLVGCGSDDSELPLDVQPDSDSGVPECEAGERRCDGLVPVSCTPSGAWAPLTACDYVCTEGACTGECVPGDQRCADEASLDICDVSGAWHASVCSHFCSAATQQCACEPGYEADGTSCTPLDFCSAPHGGCSPNASCSQVEITPSCECEPGYAGDGWLLANRSSPLGSRSWFQGSHTAFPAFDGDANTYIAANFAATNEGGTISSWLATPVLDFGALAEASFHTRTVAFEGEVWADRIEVRLCTSEPCDLPPDSGVGEYSTLLLSINPLLLDDYPREWTQFTVTNADGLPTSGKGRIAIRYYVTDAGYNATNSNYFGIDRFVWKVGAPAFRVGGTLTGLSAGAVVLWLNGGELFSLSADGAFEFAHKVDEGTPYSVSIYEQPEGQSCAVENATGSVGADDIANIQVNCTED